MEAIREQARSAQAGRFPLWGLLFVQLIVGYEWLLSGLAKLVRGDFPDGLEIQLMALAQDSPGWYRDFLDGAVIPRAHTVGYLIELGELATGLVLITAALVWLVGWDRLAGWGRAAVLFATIAGALSGIVMAINFHLANGDASPWGLPGDSFAEAVDLDSLIVAIQVVLLVVAGRTLLTLRRRHHPTVMRRPG